MPVKEKIIIVGAGGFGREVLAWTKDWIGAEGRPYEVKGFIDDNVAALDSYGYKEAVLSTVAGYAPREDEVCVMAIANPPRRKLAVAGTLLERGARFISVVHPTARVVGNARLGRGVVICPYVIITCDTIIGDFVCVNVHTAIGHDTVVGKGCTINGHCEITGKCEVGEAVFFGAQAYTHPGVKVGDDAVVGAGSVVFKKVKSGTTVIGNPAKKLYS